MMKHVMLMTQMGLRMLMEGELLNRYQFRLQRMGALMQWMAMVEEVSHVCLRLAIQWHYHDPHHQTLQQDYPCH